MRHPHFTGFVCWFLNSDHVYDARFIIPCLTEAATYSFYVSGTPVRLWDTGFNELITLIGSGDEGSFRRYDSNFV